MDRDSPGTSGNKSIRRGELFNMMRQFKDVTINEQLEATEQYLLNCMECSDNEKRDIKNRFSKMKSELKRRWDESHRKEDVFLKYNREWLQGSFELPGAINSEGRPCKSFAECCERSKRRKTEELRQLNDSEKIYFAAQTELNKEGKRTAARIFKEITSSPTRAGQYEKAYKAYQIKEQAQKLSPERALSMYVEAGLSRNQYNVVRDTNKGMYPCYSVLQKAKVQCYPKNEAYDVTETKAELNLQELVNTTITRLLESLKDVVDNLTSEDLTMVYKWGCDGSRQSTFKQTFENQSDTDAFIFQSSFAPLKLSFGNMDRQVVWQNPTPSSPRYCRPIRIRFVKESVDITNEEIAVVSNAIKQLKTTDVKMGDKTFRIKHLFALTMVDAKVCNAATLTSSTMRCYICGATTKDFNNLSMSREVNNEALKFGLSILHARIRLFESLLHISYKLPVKKWQLKESEDKDIVKQRKLKIQEDMKERMGLIVDVPKQGFGNSNDGNTSRRFFSNPELAAEITGLDYQLIYRIKVILEVISSGFKVNLDRFSTYTTETAELYVRQYNWYPMTPTMHKILMHSTIIIKRALLPIGQLSEEAAEARNKHLRTYRENYTRKFSRVACNLDVINRLLLTSDPLITGLRRTPKKMSKPFTEETKSMILPPDLDGNETATSDEEDDYMEI